MMRQSLRYFLIAALIFLGVSLYYQWEQEQGTIKKNIPQKTYAAETNAIRETKDIPEVPTSTTDRNQTASTETNKTKSSSEVVSNHASLIDVSTDTLDAKIDPLGGDIVFLKLKQFKSTKESAENNPQNTGFVLMDESNTRYYIAQSGLTGINGPDIRGVGRAQYKTKQQDYVLSPDSDRVVVELSTKTDSGVNIVKQFIFLRGSYTVSLNYLIDNNGTSDYKANFYARLKRKTTEDSGSKFLGVQTFTGAAIYTKDTPYKKINFSDMKNKPISLMVEGGWAALIEHYFLSAWIPAPGVPYTYQSQDLGDNVYAIGLIAPETIVPAKSQASINATLYAGPEVADVLSTLSPGLDLTVDYGILWPICKPIFWLLKKLFLLTGNWGVAIILVTVIIKLLFYKLSESSYRSMGNMRKMQPRIEALKERYGDDKQKFSQAVMELYKKEKINPLGGCLPILIQIPVFIALYYVLLGSVELRDAPFMLWITDLSEKDPYYVLPILMGITMWIQQKLNPAPPDPVQAKVMMAMPVIFTILFLNFPSGLVLYWLVNNVLSIAQQWYITRKIENATTSNGAK